MAAAAGKLRFPSIEYQSLKNPTIRWKTCHRSLRLPSPIVLFSYNFPSIFFFLRGYFCQRQIGVAKDTRDSALAAGCGRNKTSLYGRGALLIRFLFHDGFALVFVLSLILVVVRFLTVCVCLCRLKIGPCRSASSRSETLDCTNASCRLIRPAASSSSSSSSVSWVLFTLVLSKENPLFTAFDRTYTILLLPSLFSRPVPIIFDVCFCPGRQCDGSAAVPSSSWYRRASNERVKRRWRETIGKMRQGFRMVTHNYSKG